MQAFTRALLAAVLTVPFLGLGAATASAADAIPAYVTKAVHDGGRPQWDVARDAARKPAQVLAFAGVKPGQIVAELVPGDAYYTRILTKLVGKGGMVYAVVPDGGVFTRNERMAQRQRIAPAYLPVDPGYACVLGCYPTGPEGYLLPIDNVQALEGITEYRDLVTVLWVDLGEFGGAFPLPRQADVVFSADAYHILHRTRDVVLPQYMKGRSSTLHPLNVAAVDKAIFQALKPGGLFVASDYVAATATGFNAGAQVPYDAANAPGHPGSVGAGEQANKDPVPSVADALHRTPPAEVKAEILSAGFVLDGESNVLANPADDHAKPVEGLAAQRDAADQYLFRFKKPATASAVTKRPTQAQVDAMTHSAYGNTSITNVDVKPGVSATGQRLRMSFFNPDHTYQEFGRVGEGAGPMQAGVVYYDAAGHRCELHQFPIDEHSGVVCGNARPAGAVGVTAHKRADGSVYHSAVIKGHVLEGYVLPGTPKTP